MSSKKPKLSPAEERLKALKKLGYLKDIKAPTKNKPLTTVQRARILKNYSDLKEIVTSPDSFKKINISKYRKDDIKLLKKSGYKVKGDNIFIPTEGATSVSIKKTYSKDKLDFDRYLTITRKTNNHGRVKTIEEYIGTNQEIFEYRERLSKEKKAAKIKEGDMFGLKVYQNGMFRREIHDTLEGAFQYLENDMILHNGADKQTLLDNVHLVKIRIDNKPMDFSNMGKLSPPPDNKERGKKIYQRRKNREKLQGKVKRK